MSGVKSVTISAEDTDSRLDRWFRKHFPSVPHGRLEKLLRTGQIRVNGRRVKAGYRLAAGDTLRVPPIPVETPAAREKPVEISAEDEAWVRSLVLYQDDDLIVINKPAGLAVQGGTGTRRHLDAMLDGLRFGAAERPRLVHRLDKDTAGVLLLARSPGMAAKLAAAFRDKSTRKIYWALVAGVPAQSEGLIESALGKTGRAGRERVVDHHLEGRSSVTRYRVLAVAGGLAAWLEMIPITGRTHQLRVHAAALGTPIVGDGKYGGRKAFPEIEGIARRLHLLAREIQLPHPRDSRALSVTAPLPDHMRQSWLALGLSLPRDRRA